MKDSEKFDEFWKNYPRRIGKLDALKAYNVQIKRFDHADILLGCIRFADMCRHRNRDPQYIPYPASWLRAGRWLDDDLRGFETAADRTEPGAARADIPPQFAPLTPYLGGCTIDGQKIITPTEARKSTLINKFRHLFPDMIVEVARG